MDSNEDRPLNFNNTREILLAVIKTTTHLYHAPEFQDIVARLDGKSDADSGAEIELIIQERLNGLGSCQLIGIAVDRMGSGVHNALKCLIEERCLIQ